MQSLQQIATMPSLTDLPLDLLAAIVPWLDLGSVVRLARTTRLFSDLTKYHPHSPLLSAVRSINLFAYRTAVTRLHAQQGTASRTTNPGDDEHLCIAVVACAYILVARGSTDAEWWAPLSVLVSALPPTPQVQRRMSRDLRLGRLFVRTLKRGAVLGCARVLECFLELQEAAASDWLVFRQDWTMLPRLIQTVILSEQPTWTRQQRLDVLVWLAAIAKDVNVVGFAQSADGPNESLMETILSTNDILLIVSMCTAMNDHRANESRIDAMYLATYTATQQRYSSLFNLFSTSYIVALSGRRYEVPLPSLPTRINFHAGCAVPKVLAQLRQQYAFHGVITSLTDKFLGQLMHASLESHFLPWIFGCAGEAEPKWRHSTVELDWLFSHVHPHAAMLHTLAFNSELGADDKASHGSDSLNLVLHHVPVDLAGQSTHLAHGLRQIDDHAMHLAHCPRCAHLVQLARARVSADPLLEKFASGTWHVSCDPIPRDQWLAETRAISRLLASEHPPDSTTRWMNYVDSVAPILHTTRHGSTGTVDWRSVREAGVNKMDLEAVVYAFACEGRFGDALGLVREENLRMSSSSKDGMRVMRCIKGSLDRVRGDAAQLDWEQREQLEASAHALMCALETDV